MVSNATKRARRMNALEREGTGFVALRGFVAYGQLWRRVVRICYVAQIRYGPVLALYHL